ncbi:unnamed protein product [Symbiodinium sp. CCMP2456]|nr:unnamed protein product [Symbiodinium sp. CCMP2456]
MMTAASFAASSHENVGTQDQPNMLGKASESYLSDSDLEDKARDSHDGGADHEIIVEPMPSRIPWGAASMSAAYLGLGRKSLREALPSKPCWAVALYMGIFPSPMMFVVGQVLPGQWLSQNGKTYLSSMGLGSMLLMILIPYLTLATLLEHMAQRQNDEGAIIAKLNEQIQASDVKKAFGDHPKLDLSRRLRVYRICARALLNIFLFSYSLASLGPRDPDEPLNQTKHVLAWLEFFGIWTLALLFLLKPVVVLNARFLEIPVFALYRAQTVRALANFSALALLQRANPQLCFDRMARAPNATVLLAEVVSSLFGAALGVAAMVCKISTTAFIANTLFWDWDILQWLTLAGLLNNIAGLLQIEELRMETAARHYCNVQLSRTTDEFGQRMGRIFQHVLQKELKDAYGTYNGGFFWLAMTFEDVMRLSLQATRLSIQTTSEQVRLSAHRAQEVQAQQATE